MALLVQLLTTNSSTCCRTMTIRQCQFVAHVFVAVYEARSTSTGEFQISHGPLALIFLIQNLELRKIICSPRSLIGKSSSHLQSSLVFQKHAFKHAFTHAITIAALNDQLFFSIANHTLKVVEADAIYVKPFDTNTILIFSTPF